MRTVSFSQPQVQAVLSRDFVCFTTSTEGDPSAGESIRHRPSDNAGTCLRGNGQQNVQTLFLTPDGRIFHAVSGYIAPDDLLEELRFAQELFAVLQVTPQADQEEKLKTAHRDRLTQLEFTPEQIDAVGPNIGLGMDLSAFVPSLNPGNPLIPQNPRTAPGNRPVAPPLDPMSIFARGQILNDHKFCMKHPLMPAPKFDRDPTALIGTGKSFFMSSSGGNSGR
ncbi:MAG: hypothetical protein JNL67_18730 [Planctomycetaceae bacterium]|nr:hypothetical protein [Planctomycetaceae bacterium]